MLSGMIVLSVVCPVFALPTAFYGMNKNNNYWKVYSFLYALFFASIAYNYYPVIETDLTRYLATAASYTDKPFSYVLETDQSHLYVQDLWFWIIAQTKDYQLIPAMSTFGVYFTGAYITNYISYKQNDKSFAVWQLFMLFCCIDLTIVINYIRNILAFALILLGFFRWVVEKKKNLITLLLIFLPIWLHSIAIFLVLLVFLAPLMKYFRLASVVVIFVMGTFINFAYKNLYFVITNKFFKAVVLKAYKYFNNDVATVWANQTATNFMSKLVKFYNVSLIVFCIALFLFTRRNENEYEKRTNNIIQMRKELTLFNDYIFLIGIVTLGITIITAPIYRRFYTAFMIGSAGMLGSNFINRKFSKLLYAYSFIGLIKWLYTIHYEATLWRLAGTFITNPLYILINIIISKFGL